MTDDLLMTEKVYLSDMKRPVLCILFYYRNDIIDVLTVFLMVFYDMMVLWSVTSDYSVLYVMISNSNS